MTHSDNQGAVIPPLVASTQAVVVPIFKKGPDNQIVLDATEKIRQSLEQTDVLFKVDLRVLVRIKS